VLSLKGYKKGFIIGALLLFAFVIIFSTQVYASQSIENTAKQVVVDFFNAIKNNDIDAAMNSSIDTFWKNETERREQFVKTQKELKDFKIESVRIVDANKAYVIATISMTNAYDTTIQYPVVKEGEKWIIDISNSTVIPLDLLEKTTRLKLK
jgi:predicted  nucleic acid-binding Zn-ribbon protein